MDKNVEPKPAPVQKEQLKEIVINKQLKEIAQLSKEEKTKAPLVKVQYDQEKKTLKVDPEKEENLTKKIGSYYSIICDGTLVTGISEFQDKNDDTLYRIPRDLFKKIAEMNGNPFTREHTLIVKAFRSNADYALEAVSEPVEIYFVSRF